jgi:hypothetical protein
METDLLLRQSVQNEAVKIIQTKRSDTVVIQTFRHHSIPAWIQRCLDSVRKWAGLHGHDYSLAVAERDEKVLRIYSQAYRYQTCAGNLGLSLQHEVTVGVLWRAMEHLEAGVGDAINRYAIESGVHLVPYDKEMSAVDQAPCHSPLLGYVNTTAGRRKIIHTLVKSFGPSRQRQKL